MIILPTFKFFYSKPTPNIYLYYNHVIIKFLKKNNKNFFELSEKEFTYYNKILEQIKHSNKTKAHIDSYYTIYDTYLKKYDFLFKNKTFIDCGCAPGGFLKFADKMKMSGIGITLQEDKSESLELKYDAAFDIIYADLLDENFLQSLDTKIKKKVDFVNMGAVYYGQDDENSNEKQAKLFLNQVYIAAKYLKSGGSMMFVLDTFHSLYNAIMYIYLFINMESIVHFIPVQPAFQTTQVYILIENIKYINFETIVLTRYRPYIPITKNINEILEKVFNSSLFDIDSFREAFIINILGKSKTKIKDGIIKSKMFGVLILDIINKSNYNLGYLVYPEVFETMPETNIYNNLLKNNITKKVIDLRQKFIKKYELEVDETGKINRTKKLEYDVYLKLNKLVAKIDKIITKQLYENK